MKIPFRKMQHFIMLLLLFLKYKGPENGDFKILFFSLAHLAICRVNFCHHLSSSVHVLCRPSVR